MAQLNSASDLPAGRQVSAKVKMYYVYVLNSVNFDRNYTGFTKDLDRRVREHNLGKNKSTKAYVPWKLIHVEEFEERLEARKREKYLKSGSGREYLKKL
ncbi:GIY-YIG nuclease family protein [Namhaeicola litoreus]|uniref:GIY-YIG nuclease family protein n=1 Tax=Namhaeicola litoreus TaxID=1052145 RepID=A0ABW3XWX4_9FLAO